MRKKITSYLLNIILQEQWFLRVAILLVTCKIFSCKNWYWYWFSKNLQNVEKNVQRLDTPVNGSMAISIFLSKFNSLNHLRSKKSYQTINLHNTGHLLKYKGERGGRGGLNAPPALRVAHPPVRILLKCALKQCKLTQIEQIELFYAFCPLN